MSRSFQFIACALFTILVLLAPAPVQAQNFKNPRRVPTIGAATLVLAGDLNLDGRVDLLYAARDNQGGMTFHALLLQPDATYVEAPSPITVPGVNTQCLLADINSDGQLDVVCGVNTTANIPSMFVLLGQGDGTFASASSSFPPGPFTTAATDWPLAVADFNHDGHPDVLVGSQGYYSSIAVLFGDGTGHFTFGTYSNTSSQLTNHPVGATIADLNGDGNPDLITHLEGTLIDELYLGASDGFFGAPVQRLPTFSTLCDINGDGRLDVVGGSSGRLQIWRGRSNGTFDADTPLLDHTFSPDPVANVSAYLFKVLACRDLNQDGFLDIVTRSADGITVLFGGPGNSFTLASHTPSGYNYDSDLPAKNALVDLDGDGTPDLLSIGTGGLYLSYGFRDGTFRSVGTHESGANVTNGFVVDMNEDGIPDVVTAGSGALLLNLGVGDGSFGPATPIAGTNIPVSIGVDPYPTLVHGDFNGDGHQDILLIAMTMDTPKNYLFLGNGDGTVRAPVVSAQTGTFRQTGVFDLNGDGRQDYLFQTNNIAGTRDLTVALGQSDGTFVLKPTNYHGPFYGVGDVTGDGKLDLLGTSASGILIMPGNGDGTFAQVETTLPFPSSSFVHDIVVGDFDGDHRDDIAVNVIQNATGTAALVRFYSDGYPQFTTRASPLSQGNLYGLQAADLNGDGRDDLFVAQATSETYGTTTPSINFVTGNADRSVSGETVLLVGGETLVFPTAVDLNRDGSVDLIAGNVAPANTFSVLLNGNTAPQATGTLFATPEPSSRGAAFQLTATLAPSAGSSGAQLSGSVTFSVDGAVIGSAPIVGNSASLAGPATLTRGIHALTATWSGQAAVGSTPALGPLTLTATHAVTGLPSTTTLMASATAVPAGTAITFTATTTIQGGTAPDLSKLQIVEGATPLTPSKTISANSLNSTVVLAPGSHILLAAFVGDTNAEPSSSSPVTVSVAAAPTTLSLSNLTGVAFQNDAIVATAQFNPSPALSPGGTVTFTLAGQLLGSASLTTQNTATINVNQSAGTYPVHAVYIPSTASVSTATADGTVLVARAPVSLVFTSPLLPPATAQSKPAVLTVNFDDLTGRHLATGSIVPMIDGIPQPPIPLPTTTSFPFSITSLAPGTHSLTLTYSGDANFLPATTATATLTVLNRDFTFGGDQTLTIPAQHFRSLPVQLVSIGDFTAPVALTCADLPPFASCRFSQSPVPVSAGGAATFQLTVDTSALPGYMAANQRTQRCHVFAAALAPFTLFGLLLFRRRAPALMLLLLTATAATLIGCSGRYPAYTPPGNYTIQVVGQSADTGGTSAALTHARPITLIVTP